MRSFVETYARAVGLVLLRPVSVMVAQWGVSASTMCISCRVFLSPVFQTNNRSRQHRSFSAPASAWALPSRFPWMHIAVPANKGAFQAFTPQSPGKRESSAAGCEHGWGWLPLPPSRSSCSFLLTQESLFWHVLPVKAGSCRTTAMLIV